MGTDSIRRGCYITCAYDNYNPYGRLVNSYETLEQAKAHIRCQKEEMQSKANWTILHVIELEWIKPEE